MYSFLCKNPSREEAKAFLNQAEPTSPPCSSLNTSGRLEAEATRPGPPGGCRRTAPENEALVPWEDDVSHCTNKMTGHVGLGKTLGSKMISQTEKLFQTSPSRSLAAPTARLPVLPTTARKAFQSWQQNANVTCVPTEHL